jgi:3-phosphoshikimate 1-carboxyvinyltransferase
MVATRRVRPLDGPVEALVAVPGSKSIANRALICAALADGPSVLDNVPDGDDTAAMIVGLSALGVDVEQLGPRVHIAGGADRQSAAPIAVHAALAGTTSRFLTALAALGNSPVTIDGFDALRRRPFGPLHEALRQLGVRVDTGGHAGRLPVTVTGPPTAGAVSIRGDVSSQYVTALMLIGPYLPGGLRVTLTTPLVSRPYVELTSAVMAMFGLSAGEIGEQRIIVPPGRYRGTTFGVEADASSASYPLAVAAVRGGSIMVDGLGSRSHQGDARFADVLASMGCRVERAVDSTRVTRRSETPLRGVEIDMADISDLVPTVAAVALFATTPTRITGIGFIRGKESDRIGDLARELRRIGGDVDELDEGLIVRPSAERLHGGVLGTHHDHRLAMAFGVIGSVVHGIDVEDPDVVSKSWPGYWRMLERLET